MMNCCLSLPLWQHLCISTKAAGSAAAAAATQPLLLLPKAKATIQLSLIVALGSGRLLFISSLYSILVVRSPLLEVLYSFQKKQGGLGISRYPLMYETGCGRKAHTKKSEFKWAMGIAHIATCASLVPYKKVLQTIQSSV